MIPIWKQGRRTRSPLGVSLIIPWSSTKARRWGHLCHAQQIKMKTERETRNIHLLTCVKSPSGNVVNGQLCITVFDGYASSGLVVQHHIPFLRHGLPCPLMLGCDELVRRKSQGRRCLGPVSRSLLTALFNHFGLLSTFRRIHKLFELQPFGRIWENT